MKMINNGIHKIRLTRLLCLFAMLVWAASASAADNKYAWTENGGWVNLMPTSGGVAVHVAHLSGYAWHENAGWIKLGADTSGPYANTSSANWGVNRNAVGNLSGYGFSENAGWINFNPTGGGVSIDPASGLFDGYAWGENIGWIHFKNPQGATVQYVTALAALLGERSVSLSVIGTGKGTVTITSSPPGIACNTDCSAIFDSNSQVTLSATASQYSVFSGWSGVCTNGSGDCVITMDADKAVSASFNNDTAHYTKIDKTPPDYYPSLAEACLAASSGDTIKAWAVDFTGDLATNKSLTIKGGYDSSYTTNDGTYTTLHGTLTIGLGKLTVEKLIIKKP